MTTGKDLEPVSLAAARAALEAKSTMLSQRSGLPSKAETVTVTTATEALKTALSQGEIFGLSGLKYFEDAVRTMRSLPCDAAMAEQAVRRLLGCYPERNIVDARAYTANLITVFMAYPAAMVVRCVDPVHGLPSVLKFFPSVADVSSFLADIDRQLEARRAQGLDACDAGPYPRLRPDTYEKPDTPEARKAFVETAMGRKMGDRAQVHHPPHKSKLKPAEHLHRIDGELFLGPLEKRPPIDVSDETLFPSRSA